MERWTIQLLLGSSSRIAPATCARPQCIAAALAATSRRSSSLSSTCSPATQIPSHHRSLHTNQTLRDSAVSSDIASSATASPVPFDVGLLSDTLPPEQPVILPGAIRTGPIPRPPTQARDKQPEDLPSPDPSRAHTSAKLAALHARLNISHKVPLETLARALVDPSAD